MTFRNLCHAVLDYTGGLVQDGGKNILIIQNTTFAIKVV